MILTLETTKQQNQNNHNNKTTLQTPLTDYRYAFIILYNKALDSTYSILFSSFTSFSSPLT